MYKSHLFDLSSFNFIYLEHPIPEVHGPHCSPEKLSRQYICWSRAMIIQAGWWKVFIISPWKRAWPFIWLKFNSLHWRMLWAKFGWNCDVKCHQCIFTISPLTPFRKGGGPLKKLNPIHPWMLCAKFDWIWLGGSWEEKFTDR